MAFLPKILVQLVVVLVLKSLLVSSRSDSGEELERRRRRKRGTDQEVPDLRETLQGQSTMQATYFLGQCLMCPPGPQGPAGLQGPQGPPGRDGRDALLVGYPPGSDGSDDTPGSGGGTPGTTPGTSPLGATYTRWGRPICPEGAELIYEGVMAGSHYTHAGGAANYLCLSKDPLFDRPTAGYQYAAYIYGTEYETGSSNLLPNLQNYEVPCAVCLAPAKSLTLMVPGRNACPEGPGGREWRLEYSGFIMSQHHTHPRTEYVCVDSEAEGIRRTHGDHNGALLYIVETTCATGGGIPCPPYTEGYELTCAVCSM